MAHRGSKLGVAAALLVLLLAGCAVPSANPSEGSLTPEARLHVAEAAEASGDKQTATAMYLAAANDAPANAAIQRQAAEGLARNAALDDAQAVLLRRLKADPDDLDLLRTLGAIEVTAGKPGQGIQALSIVLAKKPADMKALVDKAVGLDILGRHLEAQMLYHQALDLSPGDAAISNNLALSLLLSGQPAAADHVLAPFRDAAALPDRIKTNLGIMDAASGRMEDARAMLGSRIEAADLSALTQAIDHGSIGPAIQR